MFQTPIDMYYDELSNYWNDDDATITMEETMEDFMTEVEAYNNVNIIPNSITLQDLLVCANYTRDIDFIKFLCENYKFKIEFDGLFSDECVDWNAYELGIIEYLCCETDVINCKNRLFCFVAFNGLVDIMEKMCILHPPGTEHGMKSCPQMDTYHPLSQAIYNDQVDMIKFLVEQDVTKWHVFDYECDNFKDYYEFEDDDDRNHFREILNIIREKVELIRNLDVPELQIAEEIISYLY